MIITETRIFLPTAILIGPEQEEIHGADFSDLLVGAVQPEDLLTIEAVSLVLSEEGVSVVPEKDTRGHLLSGSAVCRGHNKPTDFLLKGPSHQSSA